MRDKHIIIGGGIAGCSLAWRLSQAGESILLLDAGESASLIAGGAINPITGRHFSFKADLAGRLVALIDFYNSLVPYQKTPLIQDKLIFRTFSQETDREVLSEHLHKNPSLSSHIAAILDAPPAPELIGGAGVLIHGKQIDVPAVLSTIKGELTKRGQYKQCMVEEKEILELKAASVTLAEGWRAAQRGTFSSLPFKPVKGERLIVELKVPLSHPEILYKRYEMFIPLTPTNAFMGATFSWDNLNTRPTPEKRVYLEERLSTMINVPFKVIHHDAHVRPASHDRRPFLGAHPTIPRLFIFNGLGSLGLSLAPLCSEALAEHIIKGTPVPGEFDVRRITSFFKLS